NPANFTALRSLVLLHGQRGDWHRAAAYLTCAAGNALDPFDSVDLALDAAEIYRDQLHDTESAVVQYMRVLDLSPEHPKAVAALADAAWERSDWLVAGPLLEGMAGSAKRAMEETAQLWHKAAWSAQMSGDMARAPTIARPTPPCPRTCPRSRTGRGWPAIGAGGRTSSPQYLACYRWRASRCREKSAPDTSCRSAKPMWRCGIWRRAQRPFWKRCAWRRICRACGKRWPRPRPRWRGEAAPTPRLWSNNTACFCTVSFRLTSDSRSSARSAGCS